MIKQSPRLIDLSIFTLLKFFLVILALIFIYFIKDILIIFFIALIFSAAISPAVNYLHQKRIPKVLSILLLLVFFFGFLTLVVFMLIPPIVEQFSQLSTNLPSYVEKLELMFDKVTNFSFLEAGENLTVSNNFGESLVGSINYSIIFQSVFGFLGGLVTFFVIIVVTFYFLLEEDAIKHGAKSVLPIKYQEVVSGILKKIQRKIADWLKGQFVLSAIIGLLVYMGLLILGVEYALILALVAFVGEFVPYLGPILAAIPAILIGFIQAPIIGLFVLILFIIIQQAENHILVPKIMQRAVGLNPIVSIFALMIGAKLAGVLGIILAIPATTALMVIIKELYLLKELQSQKSL